MKKIFVVNKPANTSYIIPLLWASAKTYYEEHGVHSDKWHWGVPTLDYSDWDMLANNLLKESPDVVAFSMYIWNESFHQRIAQKIKERSPDTVILWGGPQCDIPWNKNFFKDNPYIDMVSPSDAYGETALAQILDNIIDNNKFIPEKLQYIYYPSTDRSVIFNDHSPNKREFNWPSNPFKAQQEYLAPFFDLMKKRGTDIRIMVETSRGCPYKCSFCDWGGGTYTKTVKKPFATVMSEIEWLGKNGATLISFADANFGMFSIDIEYIKKCISTKKKYGYPKKVLLQPTKVKLDQLVKIYEMLAENEMIVYYQIAIQDINEDVKKNVDRVDFSFDDQVAMFNQLREKKNLPIFIEQILGLPGSSMKTIKSAIDKIAGYNLDIPISHIWQLLPATPAADPEYRSKYQLKTIKNKTSDGIGFTIPLMSRTGMAPDPGLTLAVEGDVDPGEYVIETFSYNKDEWINMAMLQVFASVMMNSNIIKLLATYLNKEHNVLYGDFLEQCLIDLLDESVNIDKKLCQRYNDLRNKLINWIETDEVGDTYMIIDDSINFKISPPVYYLVVTLCSSTEFFNSITSTVEKFIKIDDITLDLINFSKNRLIDIEYLPGKTFTSEYNWKHYETHNEIKKEKMTYRCGDTQVWTGGQIFDMNWIKETGAEKIKQFIYRYCYDFKTPKVSKNFTTMSIHDMKSTATF